MILAAQPAHPGAGPLTFASGALRASLNRNGSLRLLRCGGLTLNLFPGSESEGGPANLLLRRWHQGAPVDALPLCGPASPLRWHGAAGHEDACPRRRPEAAGHGASPRRWREALLSAPGWPALRLRLELVLAASTPAWFWHLAIDHTGGALCTLDLLYLQDVGLASWDALRLNEAYVSQYLDHQPIADAHHGWLLATRQNQPVAGRLPWMLSGSLGRAVGFATDALQLTGASRRAGLRAGWLMPQLPSRRLQHEHALVALQEEPFTLTSGASVQRGFFGWFEEDHPAPSTPADADRLARVLALPEARWAPPEGAACDAAPSPSLLVRAPALACHALGEAALADHAPGPWRHEERDASGHLQSFFCGTATHAVLAAKDHAVLRPHGHLLRSGRHATPDERATASTVWMAGVFHSSLTQGHASANRLLSTQRGHLGLAHGHGLRAFVDWGGGWRRLDEPSAWLVAPERAEWVYRTKDAGAAAAPGGVRELVVTSAAGADPALMRFGWRVTHGEPPRVLLVHHVALDGDDGLVDRVPTWREEQPGTRLRIEAGPGTEMARRFPGGGLVVEVAPGTASGTAPVVRWAEATADEALHDDHASRAQPFVCLRFDPLPAVELHYRADLMADPALPTADLPAPQAPVPRLHPRSDAWTDAADAADGTGAGPTPGSGSGSGSGPVAGNASTATTAKAATCTATGLHQLAEWLPWLQHNALVHYLSPRGLEQFSGGGWGTRDVCQGPVELLSAHGRHDVVRDLLCRVFSAQNPDGDWPQWFMFFPRDAAVRAGDSHGDIVLWPLLALAEHLVASGDGALLDEALPYHGSDAEPLRRHVERAFALIARRRIPGTALAAYGHGDWNDALQPADPAMRDRLCSAWTVTLHYKLLRAWAQAWRRLHQPARAAAMEAEAAAVLADFQRLLIADGELAGYASFDDPAAPRLLLHPHDAETGIRHSALAMVHAIIDGLFTPEQAAWHADLIACEMSGPDGLRLFDRPLPYRGGPMKLFQRGESASYFGREIGLMYMHAHLRWAEALAQLGRGHALLHALRQANPIGLQALVPSAAPRQANCYYSSSDAAFADRHEASAHYHRIARGEVALEGGWRIYSSGAGIAWRLVVQRLLGFTQQVHRLVVDPVLPPSLDGLLATLQLYGEPVRVRYRVGPRGHGPLALRLNGQPLPFRRGHNRYRAAGAEVDIADWRAAARPGDDRLDVELG